MTIVSPFEYVGIRLTSPAPKLSTTLKYSPYVIHSYGPSTSFSHPSTSTLSVIGRWPAHIRSRFVAQDSASVW